MRTRIFILSALLGLCLLFAPSVHAGDALFQYSTIDALLAGLYDGKMTLRDLKFQGDFGLGTLNGLDGELIVLDGEAYHASAGGKAVIPDGDTPIPFGAVAFFKQDSAHTLKDISSLSDLNETVSGVLPTKNIFYAIRIDGDFSRVKTRAIPKQKPPYPTLARAAKKQVITDFAGRGTLVGLFSPSYVKGVGVPGFHWHFLTADRSGGGHVLDCAFAPAVARIDYLRTSTVRLPDTPAFDAVDLTGDRAKELHAVETDPAKK